MKATMNSLLCAAMSLALCSCGATQGMRTKAYDDPKVGRVEERTYLQNTGLLNEADDFAQTMQINPDGTILMATAAKRIDNKAVVDSWFMGKGLLASIKGFFGVEQTKAAGEAAIGLKGTVDPQAIPGAALGEAHVLGTVPGALKVTP